MSYYNLQTIIDHTPDFNDHILTEVEVGQYLSAYRLHIPAWNYMQGVMIVDTPYGLCILGDWCPNNNKGAIALGYHLNWFAERLSPHRLQDVFGLEESWQPDLAAEYCADWLKERLESINEELGSEEPGEKYAEAISWIERHLALSPRELSWRLETPDETAAFHRLAPDIVTNGNDWYEDIPGEGPSLRDVALLWAIQKKFSETYSKLLQTKKETL